MTTLTLYRLLRRFTGPARAYRLTFARKGVLEQGALPKG